jgi:putative endonuclease
MKQYYVYILANKRNTVLYTGVTNNLKRRVSEHKSKIVHGFTSRYNVNKLVYYETFESPMQAITREKQIKAGSRAAKERLIKRLNPGYNDLSD